ncbi:cytochrome c maturation protein CcmE [bacterium]|nr:cytochrome c maturation protein CcmE [bacterium]
MNNRKLKYLIGAVLIVAVVVWIFGSISSENITYYYTPAEAIKGYPTLKTKKIRVMGLIEKGSIEWTPREVKLIFRITENSKDYMTVEYHGAKPDMFREGQGVVVEGMLKSPDYFSASTLLVKHNEEYKTEDHTKQKEDYLNSME